MPTLKKKCETDYDRHMKFERTTPYCKKVLLGAWYEETSEYKKQSYHHDSLYRTEYTPKPLTINRNRVCENRGRGEGLDAKLLFDYKGPCYLENFASTNDLIFKHYPKLLETDKTKQPLLDCYGNITNYGLADYKRVEWWKDSLDPRRTTDSVYDMDYAWPPYTPNPPYIPSWKLKNCNTITGECACGSEEKIVYRCNPPPREQKKVEFPKMCLVPKQTPSPEEEAKIDTH